MLGSSLLRGIIAELYGLSRILEEERSKEVEDGCVQQDAGNMIR